MKTAARTAAIGAILVLIYTALIVLQAGSSTRADMLADPFGSLQEMSLWGPLIVAGV